ncbi:ABC transporter ATP-binding protein [Aurantivibrio plasticivorans]
MSNNVVTDKSPSVSSDHNADRLAVASNSQREKSLLQVKGLSTSVGGLTLIDDIDFSVSLNQTVGVVGESGSGKSTLGLSLLQLVGTGRGQGDNKVRYQGEVMFDGQDLLKMTDKELRQIRGRDISMILQDPMTSLDPVFSIGSQIEEAIQCHGQVSSSELRERALSALTKVKITEAESRISAFPHQLSGGMRQRVVGAIAVSCAPRLLIADEPTTSLDATIQMQFLQLLQDIQAEMGLSIVIVTHDFGVVAKMCHRVCVMYGGHIVESADVQTIFKNPAHPYTKALIESRPKLHEKPRRLASIAGAPPKPTDNIQGCKFAARCPQAKPECTQQRPPAMDLAEGHQVRCWYPLSGEFPENPLKGDGNAN